MPTIETNIISLALKQQLIGATLTLADDSTITVTDYEYDPKADSFILAADNGEDYILKASYSGEISATGASRPDSSTRNKHTKLK